ncbi:hypothetical protein HYH03_011685 [Edaphochlamys debaryana]|uniref:Uncharacterized protein n=1 Tax=Edaphochlamys debaryana TaxID=47281 RepID=A0A836BW87_9CHLO|nr:hypothetical protein HYH03_011685 [Edaphochlamys debaryana]|eukprot:KAG2489883.1 hypothetical protein HYH03_011685 [Edaphochlamys debaryana]
MPPRRRPLKSLKPRGAARSIENDWKGLLEIGGRLLRLRGSGPKLSVAEAESLQERLQRLLEWVVEREGADDEESVAKALSGQRALALLRLQAWAARLHPDPKQDMGESSMFQSAATTVGTLVPKVLKVAHAGRGARDIAPASVAGTPTAGFCRALLRTQALRAAAVKLSQWLQKLEAGARTHPRSGLQLHLRRTLATAQLAMDSLYSSSAMQSAMDTVDVLCYVASTSSDRPSCSHEGSAAGPAQQLKPLYQELISELEATAVMEHAARLLLQQGRVAELLEAGAAGGGSAAGTAGGGRKPDTSIAVRSLSNCAPNFLYAYSKLPDALELATYDLALAAESASAGVAEAPAAAASGGGGGCAEGGRDADEGTDAGRERGNRRGGDEDGDRDAVMAVARTLRCVLRGPAVQYAVLSYGIRTLCAADGGPSYGLADADLAWVRPLSSAPEGDGGRRRVIDAHLLAALLTALNAALYAPPALRSPPITARAAAALALRLGRIALATARGFGALSPPSEPSPDNPALVLSARRWSNALSTVMAICAGLQEEISSLEAPEGAQPRLFRRPGWAAEAEASWRLWVDVLRWAVPRGMKRADVECVVAQGLRMQGEALDELWQPEDASALPAEAPPELAAALRAGWLPALELVLVHTCAEDEPGPYSAVLTDLSAEQPEGFVWQTRAMLSYGELSQGAGVVAALGAVLWRLQRDLDLEYGSSSSGASSSGSPPDGHRPNPCLKLFSAELCPAGDARHAALYLAVALLVASPSAEEVARAPPPIRRFSLLMSSAALEWLPPLFLLVRRAVQRGGPPGLTGCSVLDHVVQALVLWISTLAGEGAQPAATATAASATATGPSPGPGPAAAPDHVHASGSGTHGGDSEAPAASGGGAAATAAAPNGSGSGLSEWQRFVVDEVGAVHVMGAALALVEKWVGSGGGGGGRSSRDGPEGGSSSDGCETGCKTGSNSATEGAGAGSTVTGLESVSSGKAGGGDSAEAAEVQEGLTTLPVTAAVIHLARLLHGRRLLGAAGAGSGPSLPWRPEALRVLRRAVEAECARELEEGRECADEHEEGAECAREQEEGPECAGEQEDGAPSSNRQEDGAMCGAALEQLAVCLEAASSGAGGSGGAPEVEGLGVDAEVLQAAAQAVNRLLGGRLGLPAVQPLAEARALRPHSAGAGSCPAGLAAASGIVAPPPR